MPINAATSTAPERGSEVAIPTRRGDPDVLANAAATDEELLVRCRTNDDRTAFAELVHRFTPPLSRYLRRLVRNEAAAEDLCQMTFLKLYTTRGSYDSRRPIRPWIYRIATNLALDSLRKAKGQRTVSLEQPVGGGGPEQHRELVEFLRNRTPTPERLAENHEEEAWLHAAVDELPDQLRTTVLLIYFEGLTFPEAATALGVPIGTVKSRVHKALRHLGADWARRGLLAAGNSNEE
jgi:RNA polymerase sigma-70 factor (ECF subfamily)